MSMHSLSIMQVARPQIIHTPLTLIAGDNSDVAGSIFASAGGR